MSYYTLTTNTGAAKLAASLASGIPVALTQMAVGDGGGSIYEPTASQTALVNEVYRASLSALEVAITPSRVNIDMVIPADIGGWYMREAGVFDSAGDMIFVIKFPETYKPTEAEGSTRDITIRAVCEVANASQVTLVIDTATALATQDYVNDRIMEELHKRDNKASVRTATTTNITLSGLQSIDGGMISEGDRILVKNQSNPTQNGIYVASSGTWVRAVDADVDAEVTSGLVVFVELGSVNHETLWALTTENPITIGSTGLSFGLIGKLGLAPIESPDFIGIPTAPTPIEFDVSTKVATTEFVHGAIGNYSGVVSVSGVNFYLHSGHVGKVVLANMDVAPFEGAIFLPDLDSVIAGSMIEVRNYGPKITLNPLFWPTQGIRDGMSGSPAPAMTINRGMRAILIKESATLWCAIYGNIEAPGTQPGMIAYFAKNSIPTTGWLKANGATVSRAAYDALFASIGTTFGVGDGSTTFNLPDLRGEFLRGWDDSRGVDTGRVFGSAQGDAFQGHWHEFRVVPDITSSGSIFGGEEGASASGYPSDVVRNAVTNGVNGTPRTASETRPRNVALLACIKY